MNRDNFDQLLETARAAQRAGMWDEALRMFEEALAVARAADDATDTANTLRWIGTVHRERGYLEEATAVTRESLDVAETAGLMEQTASALNALALIEHVRGNMSLAEMLYGRAAALVEETGDHALAAMIDQNQATLAGIRGDMDGALQLFRSALRRLRQLGDDRAASWVLHNMAKAHAELGRMDEADACFVDALDLAERTQDCAHLANIELGRAELYLQRSLLDEARVCAERAFEIFGQVESKIGLADVFRFLGVLYREMGKAHLAETHLSQSIRLARSCEDMLLEAEAENELARMHLEQGRNMEALKALNRAHRLFTNLQASRELIDIDSHLDQLENTYLQVVQVWGESIESKDMYTAGHCGRVAEYACMLAAAVGFTGRDLTWIRMGAFLHDVGKTAISVEILNKPYPLSPDEWELMKRHTVVGDQITSELAFPWDIRPIVRNHHERWDGSGYPDGLSGDDIPLTARILCVADVYDALTTTRSYRTAYARAEALQIMDGDSGRIFDPELYRLFRELIARVPEAQPAADDATMGAAAAHV